MKSALYVVFLLAAFVGRAFASMTYSMTVQTADGSQVFSTAPGNAVALSQFNLGVSTAVSFSNTSAAPGRTSFSPVQVTRTVDQYSPTLFLYLARGQPLKVSILARDTSEPSGLDLRTRYDFTSVLLNALQQSGSNGNPSAESLSFEYGALTMTDYPLNADGTAGNPVAHSWNYFTNTGS